MSLMFNRLARNFAKNGYFPTDEASMTAILAKLHTEKQSVALLDPCCGEGAALADVKNHLSTCGALDTKAWGVEYDKDRAWNAKKWLDTVAHSDVNDMVIKPRQFGFLFLNPPYGDMVADQGQLSEVSKSRKRLEKDFYLQSHPWLALGGILVLIVPHYVIDAEFASWIAKSYTDVEMYMAPEQRFKQCVIFGVKRKSDRLDTALAKSLENMAQNPAMVPTLTPEVGGRTYSVPASSTSTIAFWSMQIQTDELKDELVRLDNCTLWPQFETFTGLRVLKLRRPLRKLTSWHLAISLAAGQIQGLVTSTTGRKLLVKGDTYKDREVKVSFEPIGTKGDQREIRVATDRFVPCIRAFDMTEGPLYGHIVTIK